MKLVPLVKINEVLKLNEPLCYSQKRVGLLILLFQALVVIPSINTVLYYWKNRHAAQLVNGKVLWANLHLLFWLSLVPFVTAWMGENHFAQWPVALYGVILLLSGIAYSILVRTLLTLHGPESLLANALGSDLKGKISVVIYAVAIPLSFVNPWIAYGIYVMVAVMWLVPDRRIEGHMG